MIYNNIFDDKYGLELYNKAKSVINDFSMQSFISSGVLLGFSGGADSVFLLLFLNKLRCECNNFKILAVHVNHLIRGAEADRDESFARKFAEEIGVEFLCERVDVPEIARECKIGIEEAARNARYAVFDKILQSRNDISSIATAHNATDNLETIIMNMMRGSGSRGLSGIRPIRDNIIRPLIRIPKAEITSFLTRNEIPFVTDSTNSSLDYKRNYIRNEIIPRLSQISSSPESAAVRLSENLRCDDELIESLKEKFINDHVTVNRVSKTMLKSLHKAVFARVISKMAGRLSDKSCERIHIDEIYSHLSDEAFSICLPGEISFVIKGDDCCIKSTKKHLSFRTITS